MTADAAQELEFDLCGPLPTGVTVLEASAGTGKTFTIATLAARFVADGVGLEQLLLVTFTRMATGELRERVRERLVATERALARALAGAGRGEGDGVASLLATGPREQVELRRARLAAAIADFDAATIDTTHSFCQGVLDELGTLGDLEPDVTFTENVDDLIEEVVDDLYVRRFHREGQPPFSRAAALEVARTAIEHPLAKVYPASAPEHTEAAMRARLALRARSELERRKRALAVITYDDLLTRLQATLAGPRGPEAVARLRARYRAVLIDEFQDTDPIQWEIVSRAFGDGSVALVLIADPKQAIYAFRGADVYAYLDAVDGAGTRRTLRVNRRSDQPLIDAFDALFRRARLGHEGIVYRRVRAAPGHREPRLRGPDGGGGLGGTGFAALRVRVLDRSQPTLELTARGYAQAPSARAHIAADLAADMVELLEADARIETRAQDGARRGEERVAPRHLAVLVHNHWQASQVQAALADAGVPAVVGGAGSVFATPAARDWLALLEALERPAAPSRARAAALTPLLGWSARDVALASEAQLEELHQRLFSWAHVLRARGMAALAETIALGERLPGRVLTERGGERRLTDLTHVAELLHRAAATGGLGVAALAGWLRQRIDAAADRERGDDELARRLESDAEAVQVLTIHRAKGLEFPIVYCPFLWEPSRLPRHPVPVYFHDAEQGNRRAIDVGISGHEYRDHLAQYEREERGEELRLAYVALTRARHQVVLWWAGGWKAGDAPLTRLALSQDDKGNVRLSGPTPSDRVVFERFEQIAAGAAGAVAVEWSRQRTPARYSGAGAPAAELDVARLERRLDLAWRRTSYTAITAAAHEAWVASEPEERGITDEPEHRVTFALSNAGEASDAPAGPCQVETELPLAAMAVGARVGTVVHTALEVVEFTAGDLAGALTGALAAGAERSGVELGCPVTGAGEGLALALATPLGGALGSTTLRELARADRLDELEFELPLAGGDRPAGSVGLAAVASLLRRELAPDDPLAGYAERLLDPALSGTLRGYLTGTIDLVLRIRGTEDRGGRDRYAIVDYKTNWLAAPGESLTAWHYRPAALAAEMQRSHYALQALLYLVALHRFLRWRVPDYDPDDDLLGVHYLFLRGMLGADAPVFDGGRSGVFAWRPEAAVVIGLSDLLAGRSAP